MTSNSVGYEDHENHVTIYYDTKLDAINAYVALHHIQQDAEGFFSLCNMGDCGPLKRIDESPAAMVHQSKKRPGKWFFIDQK